MLSFNKSNFVPVPVTAVVVLFANTVPNCVLNTWFLAISVNNSSFCDALNVPVVVNWWLESPVANEAVPSVAIVTSNPFLNIFLTNHKQMVLSKFCNIFLFDYKFIKRFIS